MRKNRLILLFILVVVAAASSACTDGDDGDNPRTNDERAADEQLRRYQDSQPPPVGDWSQLRQNLIDIERSQIETTQTTTFFFLEALDAPIAECPSIGYPIPSTWQITNPSQVVTPGSRERGSAVVAQIEANGVFTGDSTGTYAVCVDAEGQGYARYWEGYVMTVAGPAEWRDGQVRLTGEPSFDFSEGQQ